MPSLLLSDAPTFPFLCESRYTIGFTSLTCPSDVNTHSLWCKLSSLNAFKMARFWYFLLLYRISSGIFGPRFPTTNDFRCILICCFIDYLLIFIIQFRGRTSWCPRTGNSPSIRCNNLVGFSLWSSSSWFHVRCLWYPARNSNEEFPYLSTCLRGSFCSTISASTFNFRLLALYDPSDGFSFCTTASFSNYPCSGTLSTVQRP